MEKQKKKDIIVLIVFLIALTGLIILGLTMPREVEQDKPFDKVYLTPFGNLTFANYTKERYDYYCTINFADPICICDEQPLCVYAMYRQLMINQTAD